ncbi:MAG: polysaccharide deacetylase family protein [Aestuariivirga sp.]
MKREIVKRTQDERRGKPVVNRRTVLGGIGAVAGLAAAPWAHAAGDPPTKLAGAPAIVVRSTENITEGSWVWLLDTARDAGVGRIYLLVKQDENNYPSEATGRKLRSGELLVPVTGGATAEGWEDPAWLDEMLARAATLGIEVHAWWPCFQDAIATAKFPHASYAGRGHDAFVDPAWPEVRGYQADLLGALLHRYPFDGVALDWVRYNDRADGSTGPLAARFTDLTGKAWSKEAMADPLARATWDDLRARTVADWVGETISGLKPRHPDVFWSAFVLPWTFKEVAQSYRHLSAAGLDALQPMIYWRDWKKSVDFVSEVISPAPFYLGGRTTLDPTFDITGAEAEIAEALDYLPADRLGTVTWYQHGIWSEEDFQKVAQITRDFAKAREELYGEPLPALAKLQPQQRLEPATFSPDATLWSLVCLGELHRRKALEHAEPMIPVLGLHRFTEGGLESGASDWHTSTAYVDALLAFLKADNFSVMPVETLAAYMTAEDPGLLPARPLVITIDDGSASVVPHFEPRAAAAGIPYALALVTSWMSAGEPQMVDVGEGLMDANLTWQQALALHKTGRVSMMSHTHAQHRYAAAGATGNEQGPAITTRLWVEATKRRETETERLARISGDLRQSRETLMREFGGPSTILAWPYGLHDDAAEAAAMDAGFTHFLEFGGAAISAPREKPRRILRLSVMLTDEAVPLAFPTDGVTAQRWWLAFLTMARATKSVDLIDAALNQLEPDQAGHPEAEISRAAELVLNGHSGLAMRRLARLRGLYPHDATVHSAADDFEATYQGLV